jgi:CheY-like chemotaxis protein
VLDANAPWLRFGTEMLRILVVEDNEMNSDMLSRRLLRKGWQVSLARTGREGVEMAVQTVPDLILMDMSLPEIDGWTATRMLRENPATQHIGIIALTAHAMSGDRERALEAGCDSFETKPINFVSLTAKIAELTDREVKRAIR